MIRIEVICAHAEEPRARDAKHPCDSTRNRNLSADVAGTFDKARTLIENQAKDRGWKSWLIPSYGVRKALICGNCHRRAKGEI